MSRILSTRFRLNFRMAGHNNAVWLCLSTTQWVKKSLHCVTGILRVVYHMVEDMHQRGIYINSNDKMWFVRSAGIFLISLCSGKLFSYIHMQILITIPVQCTHFSLTNTETWILICGCLRYTMFGAWFTYVLLTLSCLPAVSVSIRSDFHTLIRPYTYTSRGEWGFVDWCPFGTYAYAFNLKFEKPQGKIGDDTALNGIRLDCRYV